MTSSNSLLIVQGQLKAAVAERGDSPELEKIKAGPIDLRIGS